MNKEGIAGRVMEKTGYRTEVVTCILNAALSEIKDEVLKGNTVSLSGFGTFKPKERAARVGRNPHTGESVQIPARVLPIFKPGNSFKNAVIKANES